jgi:hypothetical protein
MYCIAVLRLASPNTRIQLADFCADVVGPEPRVFPAAGNTQGIVGRRMGHGRVLIRGRT